MSSADATARSVAVVGASAAGVSAAVALRRSGFPGRITLIDGDSRTPYERPPLSKSILGVEEVELRPIVPESTFTESGIELILGTPVARIDPRAGEVHMADGTVIRADDIVLATGVRARPLAVPGADLDGVLHLRDAADAEQLRRALSGASTRHLLVVGASFIGLELAAMARGHDVEVTVLDVAPGPLVHAFGEEVGKLVQRLHEDRGVRFRFGVTVRELIGATSVEAAVLTDGTVLPASVVVAGIGVTPATELARAAGINVDDCGIVVDPYGRTSVSNVYACGDVASQPHPALEGPGRIEHWDAALRHGTAVGTTVAGQPTVHDDLPYAWSDQYGLTLQYFGRRRAGDELVIRAGATPARFLALWFRDSRIVAALGCDARREIGMARRLITEELPVRPSDFSLADADLKILHREARERAGASAGAA